MIIILETKSKKGCFTTNLTQKGLHVFNVFDNIHEFLIDKTFIKSIKFGLNVLKALRRIEKYACKENIPYKNVVEFSKDGMVYTNNNILYKANISLDLPNETDKIYIHLDMLAQLKSASFVHVYKSNTTEEMYALFDNLNGDRILMQFASKEEVEMPDYQKLISSFTTDKVEEIKLTNSARTLIENNKNNQDLKVTVIAENKLILHSPSYYKDIKSIQQPIKSNVYATFDTPKIATVFSQNSRFYISHNTGFLIAENLEGFKETTILSRMQYINSDSQIFQGFKILKFEEYQEKVKEMLQIYLEKEEKTSIAA